jgi:hypothetical protein
MAADFDKLLLKLEADFCQPHTREFALVKTHLELACFYAKKSMAQNASFQEKEEG